MLKKENEVIREGNDYIGVFSQEMNDDFKKLSKDMTANIKAHQLLKSIITTFYS